MKKPDLTKLTGEQLFDYYTAEGGEYAQVLLQAHLTIDNDLYKLLEDAEKQGKKVVLKEEMPDADDSPVTVAIE